MDRAGSVAPDADTAGVAGCAISEQWTDRLAVISASGALDMLTAPRLSAAITASLSGNPSAIIVDLSDTDFLASAGMSALVAGREEAGAAVEFRVVADGPATSRPLKMVGLADLIGLHPTLDAARATLSA